MSDNYFVRLNGINVQDKVEKKNGLSYLSWSWAWGEIKKVHPDATYTVYENSDGMNYHTDGRTCWVKTGVTVNGIEHIEYLPVMDNRKRSIPLDKVTSFEVNTAIQRSITKACARHGLGLYIYAGEDLPDGEEPPTPPQKPQKPPEQPPEQPPEPEPLQYMATQEQIDYMYKNATPEQLSKAIDKYGPGLKNMTYSIADVLIDRINNGR